MKRFCLVLALFGLMLVGTGCSTLTAVAPTPTEPPATSAALVPPTAVPPTELPPTAVPSTPSQPPAPTATATPAGLTAEQLKNGTYLAPAYTKTVTLSHGAYEAGSGADYYSASLVDPLAFGDLNGDGVDDAAVLLAENGGGSGVFVSVVPLLNLGGQPVQAGGVLVDDRPKINALTIQHGQISLSAIIHGADDPACCPAFPVTETYQLSGGGLELVRLDSQTAAGTWRAIRLASPAPGASVTGTVPVKGTTTQAPFENGLVYRLVDAQGRQLGDEGPVRVATPELGGAGTFDEAIELDLSKFPAGSTVRLEVYDVSAADGSMLAMDSVELVVK